jgi:hypothetical protein
MTFTALANLQVTPDLIRAGVTESRDKVSFYNSGIVTVMGELSNTRTGGQTVDVSHWNDISLSRPASENVVSGTDLGINNITQNRQTAVVAARGTAFGENDTAVYFSGLDPLDAVVALLGNYWSLEIQEELFAVLAGVLNTTVAAGKVYDITAEANPLFNAESLYDAVFTMGDDFSVLTAMAVHSKTLKAMLKQDLIDFTKDSQGAGDIPTYLGRRVIVNDLLPYDNGTKIATTYLFGLGAVAESTAIKMPVMRSADHFSTEQFPDFEIVREGLKSRTALVTRRTFIMHPMGFAWTGAATPLAVGVGPTRAQLANDGNWTQVFPDKNIRMVRFEHTVE